MINRNKKIAMSVVRAVLLAIFLIAALLPLYWIFVTSIKAGTEIYTFPLKYWPDKPSFDSYKELFSFSNFGMYFRNSLLISLSAAFGAMVVSILAGFALSRLTAKRLKGAIELGMYFTQTIPTFIIMVPIFTIFSYFHLINSRIALGFVYVATVVAFCTVMGKSFFDRIPASLEEAAKIDGCNLLQALTKVILPITLPGMAAIFCFAFINIWNELFIAVTVLSSSDKMTVPVALNSFISKTGISWGVMGAGVVVALLPTMIVFGIGQKYIVAGLTDGGVKG